MNRKTLTRIAFAAVAAPVLALGGPAVAMADSFYATGGQHAGPTGAHQWGKGSAVASPDFHHKGDKGGHHHGGAVYVDGYEYAGPWGAGQGGTISGTR